MTTLSYAQFAILMLAFLCGPLCVVFALESDTPPRWLWITLAVVSAVSTSVVTLAAIALLLKGATLYGLPG